MPPAEETMAPSTSALPPTARKEAPGTSARPPPATRSKAEKPVEEEELIEDEVEVVYDFDHVRGVVFDDYEVGVIHGPKCVGRCPLVIARVTSGRRPRGSHVRSGALFHTRPLDPVCSRQPCRGRVANEVA